MLRVEIIAIHSEKKNYITSPNLINYNNFINNAVYAKEVVNE